MSSMKAFFSSSFRLSLPSGPAKPCFWASSRRSASEDRPRANTASAMPVTGTARDSAVCTVQVPVPFMPAWSTMRSTSGLPVFLSTWCSTSAVISMR